VELATVGLLDRLCRVAPGEIAKDANAPTRCIMATAAGIGVLEYFGVRAEPVPVYAWVPESDLRALDGKRPSGRESAPSRFVAIDERSRGQGPLRDKGWPGHLLIGVEGEALVDLNLRAFQRPHKGIELPDAEWWEAYASPEEWAFYVNGTQIVYAYHGRHVVSDGPRLEEPQGRDDAAADRLLGAFGFGTGGTLKRNGPVFGGRSIQPPLEGAEPARTSAHGRRTCRTPWVGHSTCLTDAHRPYSADRRQVL
jgi:hypothetical protein